MTWRTARRYTKTGGRGYGAEPIGTSATSGSPSPGGDRPPGGGRPGGERPPGGGRPGDRPPPTTSIPEIPPATITTMPRPTLRFIPKGSDLTFHPPGPGIGLRPGPAPALGRPGLLPDNHGGWKNESCYSRGSKSWKPDIKTLHTSHICPGEKGPQSPYRPPNVSQDAAGYNSRLFRDENDVGHALKYLGYDSPDGNAMLRSFQRHWNRVSSQLALDPGKYTNLMFVFLPKGNLKQDGEIGPHSLNALEVAIANQRATNMSWSDLVCVTSSHESGYGRERLYNAAQGM